MVRAKGEEDEPMLLSSEDVQGAQHDGGRGILGRSAQRRRLSRRQGRPAPSWTHEDDEGHRRRLQSRRMVVGDTAKQTRRYCGRKEREITADMFHVCPKHSGLAWSCVVLECRCVRCQSFGFHFDTNAPLNKQTSTRIFHAVQEASVTNRRTRVLVGARGLCRPHQPHGSPWTFFRW